MKRLLLVLLLPVSIFADAQPLQTLYYPDGSKAIEGHWRMSSSALISTSYFGTSQRPRDPDRVDPDVFATLGMLNGRMLNLHPDGVITTWYDRGGKQLEVTFVNGVATGPYTEYYFNGKIAQQGKLERGMPSGTWTTYDLNGIVYYTGRYIPFTDSELTALWQSLSIRPNTNNQHAYWKQRYQQHLIDDALDTTETEEARITIPVRQIFSPFVPGIMAKREGTFRFYYRTGKSEPLAVLCYRNNARDSLWTYWNTIGGKPTITLEYSLGVLLSIRDSTGKYSVAQYVAHQKAAEEHARKKREREELRRIRREGVEGVVAVEQPPPPRIYKYVEQNPAFNGDIERWLKANLQYPRRALNRQQKADVTVRFLIDAVGNVRDAIILYGADEELFNNEALRLMSIMPPWKPYKLQGKALPVFWKLTFSFRPDRRRK